jgi:hypothetical protein
MSKEETKETKEEIKVAPTSRRDAIEKGMEEAEKNEKETSEEGETKEASDESTETKEIKETPEEKVEREAAEKVEVENAIKLYKALNDPEQGPKVLRMLAKEAGVLEEAKEAATTKEKKAVAKSIREVVNEKLGSEYKFLADKIGDLMEELLPEITKPLQERIDAKDRADLSKEIDTALNNCFNQYEKVPDVVQRRFNELIDEMPPVPGKTEPAKYFNRLMKIAADETNTELKLVSAKTSVSKQTKDAENSLTKTIKERVERNKRDVTSTLASKGAEAEVDETSKDVSRQPKSRREAIERAAKEVEAAMKG